MKKRKSEIENRNNKDADRSRESLLHSGLWDSRLAQVAAVLCVTFFTTLSEPGRHPGNLAEASTSAEQVHSLSLMITGRNRFKKLCA